MLGKPRAHSERTFAHKSAHLRKRAHISKVPTSTFVCHNSARAENCKTYTFHDHEHKFKRAEKSVLWKIQAQAIDRLPIFGVQKLDTDNDSPLRLHHQYIYIIYRLSLSFNLYHNGHLWCPSRRRFTWIDGQSQVWKDGWMDPTLLGGNLPVVSRWFLLLGRSKMSITTTVSTWTRPSKQKSGNL